MILKNKNYTLKNTIKIGTSKLSKIVKKKIKIQKKINNINNIKIPLKKRRNLIQFSYFSRFILRKRHKPRFFFWKNTEMNNEATVLTNLKELFKKQELKNRIKNTKFKKIQNLKNLSNRSFLFGILYLKYLRSNFFANLNWEISSAKSSSGEKFKGPKKKTMHAREAVLQKMSNILSQQKISTLDIHITPFGKVYKHLCRIFFRSTDVYVRYLLTPRKRSHGFTRPSKIRRT